VKLLIPSPRFICRGPAAGKKTIVSSLLSFSYATNVDSSGCPRTVYAATMVPAFFQPATVLTGLWGIVYVDAARCSGDLFPNSSCNPHM
jgi:hypothetical protein